MGIHGDFWGFMEIFGDKVKKAQIPKNIQKSPFPPLLTPYLKLRVEGNSVAL